MKLCKLRFFNDEILYKHLADSHFNCQICKDKKNLVFYEDIPNLVRKLNSSQIIIRMNILYVLMKNAYKIYL